MQVMLLEARSLAKAFAGRPALHEVSLQVGRGEVLGFLGPNGAGKTTTLRILAGVLAADRGTVTVDGVAQDADPIACRRRVGYLPQELPLYREMAVDAYLDHVARLKGLPAAGRGRNVLAALERCDLLAVRARRIGHLSGGYQQRVGLAQALLGDPPLLILDEPTAGLDPVQVAAFRDLVRGLAVERGVLLSTHVLSEVEHLCTRVTVIQQGRSILDESVASLTARARQVSRLHLRLESGGEALADRLRLLPWVRSVAAEADGALAIDLEEAHRHEVLPLASACGPVAELRPGRRSLEEVFRDLTAGCGSSVPGGKPAL